MGIILFIVAVALSVIICPIGYIYSILKTMFVYSSRLFLLLAIGIDMLGNVICKDLFNDTLRKKGGYEFGNMNETVSKVLGMNKKTNTLTFLGKALANFLNFIDKNHVENASKNE